MNPYLISLMIYLLLITPLRLSFRLRIGRRAGYLIRLQAAGLPFYRRRRDEDPKDEVPIDQKDLRRTLRPERLRPMRILLQKPVRSRLLKAIHLEWLSLYVHISSPDAAQTALLYGSLRSAADAFIHASGSRLPVRIHLKCDFQGQGSQALLRGIVRLRLGSLFPAAFALIATLIRAQTAKDASKEDLYAAASH